MAKFKDFVKSSYDPVVTFQEQKRVDKFIIEAEKNKWGIQILDQKGHDILGEKLYEKSRYEIVLTLFGS